MASGTIKTPGWKLLWTNPNPSAQFAQQTISVDLSKYSFFRIIFSDSAVVDGNFSNKRLYSADFLTGYNGELQMLYLPSGTGACHAYTKSVASSTSSVTIGDTKDKALNGTTAATTSNMAVIPQFIYAQ